MFTYIVNNIIERYSREELSERYGVNLPNYDQKAGVFDEANTYDYIEGHFYEIVNGKKFSKEKGEKAKVAVLEDGQLMYFQSRLGWLANLIAMILAFIENLKLKFYNFLMGLIPDIPENLKGIVKMIIFLITFPFTVILMFFTLVRKIFQSPGGILGIAIGIVIGIFVFFFMLLLELIGILLSPAANKISDSMLDHPIIKKMVIGSYVFGNNFSKGLLLENSMIDNVSFEISKNLFGQEKLYVVAKEGNLEASLFDKILAFIFPTYFVNRRTVFVTDSENQHYFENLYAK